MLFAVWGLLTALVLAHMPVGQPALRQAARLSARCALLGAPIMVLLFVLFPRIGPLWGVPQDGLAKTGLSNSMQMGRFAELALDDSIALRIRFPDGAGPRPRRCTFAARCCRASTAASGRRVRQAVSRRARSRSPSCAFAVRPWPTR